MQSTKNIRFKLVKIIFSILKLVIKIYACAAIMDICVNFAHYLDKIKISHD